MKPSEIMTEYVKQTWGKTFGQTDLIDAVVRAAGQGSRGRPAESGAPFWGRPAKNRMEQKKRILEWMDWMDRDLAKQGRE